MPANTFQEFNLYFSNNFEDFWSSLILLWDLLVVNNWHVFLYEFGKEISTWTQVIFCFNYWLQAGVFKLGVYKVQWSFETKKGYNAQKCLYLIAALTCIFSALKSF